MFWVWAILTILLFYFLALLQTSFIIHFTFWGIIPNFLFIVFFIYAFFVQKKPYLKIILIGFLAGFLLDVFSVLSIGISISLLIILGFITKKTQLMLKEGEDNLPYGYFMTLFVVNFVVYCLAIKLCYYFIGINLLRSIFVYGFLLEIIYNAIFASIGFYMAKNLLGYKKNV